MTTTVRMANRPKYMVEINLSLSTRRAVDLAKKIMIITKDLVEVDHPKLHWENKYAKCTIPGQNVFTQL